MKRLLTVCIIVSAIALFALPAFAEVQNVKVSGDVNSAGVYRNDYDLMQANRNNSTYDSTLPDTYSDNNNFLYTQARVRVDADLTDNVMATVRLLSEWDWCTESNTSGDGDNVDIDLANVTLKEAFYSPLTIIVGRQELRYGTGFVVADPDTNTTSADSNLTATDMSLRKSFDAVRTILDYNPWTIDMIFAKMDESNTTKDDEDLYGVNVAYMFDNYDAEAEAYWFLNRDDSEVSFGRAAGETADTNTPGHTINTFGVRGSMTPAENLNILGEVAWQRGDFDKISSIKRDQEAYAFQLAANYTLSEITWEPMLRLGYTHYSGEEIDDTGNQEAWIPLYEDQTHGVVANYILGGINGGQNSNAEILNIGASGMPMEDLTVSIDYYKFWLDEKLVSTSNTAIARGNRLDWTNLTENSGATGYYYANSDDDLGYEVDLALNYDYTEDVKMGLSAGWFVPGKALEGEDSDCRNDETAIQVLATLDVAF
ncbi:MAG: alginate export family protein [Candidatus Omnitrophica bacterium]|nr:alginate export family protein [Candidatus Omnitrophota bacterium]